MRSLHYLTSFLKLFRNPFLFPVSFDPVVFPVAPLVTIRFQAGRVIVKKHDHRRQRDDKVPAGRYRGCRPPG